jgi:hypothetical protein
MKLSCILFFWIYVSSVYSQSKTTTATVPQPQYLNNIYLLSADSLVSLEKNQAEMKNKTKAFGFGGSETGYVMDGGKSPFRIRLGVELQFVVKMNSTMMDPSMMIKLYRFESGKTEREAILGGGGGMFNKKKDPGVNVEVQCNMQKSGTDVFIITPATKVSSGEYGFLNMMLATSNGTRPRYTIFAFGVDD